jgi:V8-like Glu-specific endopeptidase
MRHSVSGLFKRLGLGFAAAAVTLIGCAAEEDTTGQIVSDPIAAGLLPADWPGTKMGIELPKFRDEGKVNIVRVERGSLRPPTSTYPTDPSFEQVPEDDVTMIDTTTGRSYHVTLPPQIGLVAEARAAELARKVLATPTAPEPTSADAKKVLGDDTRTRLGIADGVAKDSWMAALGYRDGCTGVLISPTAYLTAAHCVFNEDGDLEKSSLIPRSDWSGTSVSSETPWGWWDDEHVFVPGAYTQNECHERFTADCIQYDIALVRVKRDPFEAVNHRWWFTPVSETRSELQTRQLKNRGYAGCQTGRNGQIVDDPEGPPNCWSGNARTLWGDQQSCALGDDVYLDVEYSPEVFHTCDTNGGHSGSPIFYYRPDGTPVLVGLHSSGEKSDTASWNSFKRFSPNTLRWINGLL